MARQADLKALVQPDRAGVPCGGKRSDTGWRDRERTREPQGCAVHWQSFWKIRTGFRSENNLAFSVRLQIQKVYSLRRHQAQQSYTQGLCHLLCQILNPLRRGASTTTECRTTMHGGWMGFGGIARKWATEKFYVLLCKIASCLSLRIQLAQNEPTGNNTSGETAQLL
jgi:hypothetical protein